MLKVKILIIAPVQKSLLNVHGSKNRQNLRMGTSTKSVLGKELHVRNTSL
jgi:hypothetical protein